MSMRMAAVVVGAASLSACGPAVVVQGFGVPASPDCLVDASTPLSPRGTLDVGAATRYASVIRARTARDATLAVNEAEVTFSLTLSPDDAQLFATAAAQVAGAEGLVCDTASCATATPLLVPTVTAEAGVVDDERILLVSTDLIPGTAGEALAAIFATARDLDPFADLGLVETTVEVTLLDASGGRSLPATFVLDLCLGCLAPDDVTCGALNATAQTVDDGVCLPGQDQVSAICVCGDGSPAPASGC